MEAVTTGDGRLRAVGGWGVVGGGGGGEWSRLTCATTATVYGDTDSNVGRLFYLILLICLCIFVHVSVYVCMYV